MRTCESRMSGITPVIGAVALSLLFVMVDGTDMTVSEPSTQATPGPCQLPVSPGECESYQVRYYYDAPSEQCESFIYGGCGGNENRFDTEAGCKLRCAPAPLPSGNACDQPLKIGPCRALVPRWYYIPLKNKCKKFYWGGCQPNGNNFETREACKTACSGGGSARSRICVGQSHQCGFYGARCCKGLHCCSLTHGDGFGVCAKNCTLND